MKLRSKHISAKTLFITTSPRSPMLMLPDIKMLKDKFTGREWDNDTQAEFMTLRNAAEEGRGDNLSTTNLEFAARDRINRSPKGLGFVRVNPVIQITPAGEAFLTKKRKGEILLRQLLKYQWPSPYHLQTKAEQKFWVKPYLEMFRLIRHFGSLTFDEIRIFGLQLINYNLFDEVVEKIEDFRRQKALHKGKYKEFVDKLLWVVTYNIYEEDIIKGKAKARETADTSVQKFLKTKVGLSRDYTDALFRYLRATGMVNISQSGRSLSIAPEKIQEVDFFLANVERDPCFVEDPENYIEYLGDPYIPCLYTDNRNSLIELLRTEFPETPVPEHSEVPELKDLLDFKIEEKKQSFIDSQIQELKDMRKYDEIVQTFQAIKKSDYYDTPLMFEWNTWRAMTMIDGGTIKANLNFDDNGKPLSTAAGNTADIECDYDNFGLTVEVTMSSGQTQFKMESEPVPRHLGKIKERTRKQHYCLFIAPRISPATVAFFYSLRKAQIDFYGGDTIVVPMELEVFEKMLGDSYKATYTPNPTHVENFFKKSMEIADRTSGGQAAEEWYRATNELALNWLN